MSRKNKQNWYIGLLIIFLIYSLFYIFFVENDEIILVNRKLRHAIKFLTTFSVYLIGTFYLKKLHETWMNNLWHIIHIGGLFILIFIGLFDWIIFPTPIAIRHFANIIQELLISPVLYVGMSIMNKTLEKIKS